MTKKSSAPAGLRKRDEVLLLLLAALLTLVVVAFFVLFSYRNTLDVLVAERRLEAEGFARQLARQLAGGPLPRSDDLARQAGAARAVALLDDTGLPLVSSGEFTGAAPSADETLRTLARVQRDVISGTAPLYIDGRGVTVQVDLPAGHLRTGARALRLLMPTVLGVSIGLVLFVLVYVRQLLAPFERLVRRARDTGRTGARSDEVDVLLATFEATLEKLAAPSDDDLDALGRTLTRIVRSGLLLTGTEGGVLALNEIGVALLGVPPPEPGTALETLLEPHAELLEVLRTAIRERRGLERREISLDGGRTLGLTLHPLRRDDGEIRGFLAFFVDLTQVRRQAAEHRLAENLAEIGELAAGVAHEMRNSLATLGGYLTLIERGGENVGGYVEELRHETDHLKRVVDDFLSFARPGNVRSAPVDLGRLLRRAAADPALAVPVRFVGMPEESVLVRGDDQLLERAFKNLLANAAEAERQGRGEDVEVGWSRGEERVEVVIADRGPGLPEEIRDRLFHPFVSGRSDGVGLGLALTHRIVGLHHGSVRLEDRGGGGVRAVVELPLPVSR